ncbi:hypothetical protein Taro_024971 [Colocasia esculenta]|uniref:Uncharacterized protein n=1 Tax=Colocasia esculenta TaxID=4460 RepID=A0A843V1Y0_COLES|nr:hypothetical protein [Colocasia esculenta]
MQWEGNGDSGQAAVVVVAKGPSSSGNGGQGARQRRRSWKAAVAVAKGPGGGGQGARQQQEKVIEICQEKDLMNSSNPTVLSPILDVVCNGHHGGYERGCGLGWSRMSRWGDIGNQSSNDNIKQLTIELQNAKAEIEVMHAREKEREEAVQAREKEMQDRMEHIEAMLSMHFSNSAVSPLRLEIRHGTMQYPTIMLIEMEHNPHQGIVDLALWDTVGIALKPGVIHKIQISIGQAVAQLMMNFGTTPGVSTLQSGMTDSVDSSADMLNKGYGRSAGPSVGNILQLTTKPVGVTASGEESSRSPSVVSVGSQALNAPSSGVPVSTRTEKVINSFLQNPIFKDDEEEEVDKLVSKVEIVCSRCPLGLRTMTTVGCGRDYCAVSLNVVGTLRAIRHDCHLKVPNRSL